HASSHRALHCSPTRRSSDLQGETARRSERERVSLVMTHPTAEATTPAWREAATDALGYWERRRILYNVVLALVAVGHFLAALPGSRTRLSWDTLFALFLLAVLANVCYSAAYLADLFVQLSGFRIAWTRWRWGLLLVGTAFASIVAHYCAEGIFAGTV